MSEIMGVSARVIPVRFLTVHGMDGATVCLVAVRSAVEDLDIAS